MIPNKFLQAAARITARITARIANGASNARVSNPPFPKEEPLPLVPKQAALVPKESLVALLVGIGVGAGIGVGLSRYYGTETLAVEEWERPVTGFKINTDASAVPIKHLFHEDYIIGAVIRNTDADVVGGKLIYITNHMSWQETNLRGLLYSIKGKQIHGLNECVNVSEWEWRRHVSLILEDLKNLRGMCTNRDELYMINVGDMDRIVRALERVVYPFARIRLLNDLDIYFGKTKIFLKEYYKGQKCCKDINHAELEAITLGLSLVDYLQLNGQIIIESDNTNACHWLEMCREDMDSAGHVSDMATHLFEMSEHHTRYGEFADVRTLVIEVALTLRENPNIRSKNKLADRIVHEGKSFVNLHVWDFDDKDLEDFPEIQVVIELEKERTKRDDGEED